MNIILGAGLAGLSASYHLGHERCILLEQNQHAYGHLHTEFRDGFTWDQGPHVSFTKHPYVRELFSRSVKGEFEEYEVKTTNYFRGHWIDHPAQTALYQIPEPLRSACLASFLKTRKTSVASIPPSNYAEWLKRAFGPVFAKTFPFAYTRKYWTRDPAELTTDWVGGRVFHPNVEEVLAGSRGPLGHSTHYITQVRYPKQGGYQSFAHHLALGAKIQYGSKVSRIDLISKCVYTIDGKSYPYKRLVNTLPLPVFIELCQQATAEIKEAARSLSCSQLLLINVTAPHPTRRPENWMYVYDEDKLSTRINFTERLTLGNAPTGHTGVQVEVYSSRHRPLSETPLSATGKVKEELIEMGLIDAETDQKGEVTTATSYAPWANIIFDHETRPALATIFNWLEGYGMNRSSDDLDPITDWTKKPEDVFGTLILAGRFGQWKYYWTDDCVLRGKLMLKLS